MSTTATQQQGGYSYQPGYGAVPSDEQHAGHAPPSYNTAIGGESGVPEFKDTLNHADITIRMAFVRK
ncbi:hypothetical protein HDU76_011861, partial [Blyttiomyces sp. JEL0837]